MARSAQRAQLGMQCTQALVGGLDGGGHLARTRLQLLQQVCEGGGAVCVGGRGEGDAQCTCVGSAKKASVKEGVTACNLPMHGGKRNAEGMARAAMPPVGEASQKHIGGGSRRRSSAPKQQLNRMLQLFCRWGSMSASWAAKPSSPRQRASISSSMPFKKVCRGVEKLVGCERGWTGRGRRGVEGLAACRHWPLGAWGEGGAKGWLP